MVGRRPEGHIKDPRNTRMEQTSRRQRKMDAFSERDQGPEGTVAPRMKWMNGWLVLFWSRSVLDVRYQKVYIQYTVR
jgi:hypothetical protein